MKSQSSSLTKNSFPFVFATSLKESILKSKSKSSVNPFSWLPWLGWLVLLFVLLAGTIVFAMSGWLIVFVLFVLFVLFEFGFGLFVFVLFALVIVFFVLLVLFCGGWLLNEE